MPGLSNSTSLSLTSDKGCLPSFIWIASAVRSGSGGLKAGSFLNMRPNRASLSRPALTATSMPRWSAECDPRGARRFVFGAALAMAVARPPVPPDRLTPPTTGASATAVRPARTPRRESCGPPVAPLNGHPPWISAVCFPMRRQPSMAPSADVPDGSTMGGSSAWPQPSARGYLTPNVGWLRDGPVSPGVLHRCRPVAREDLVDPRQLVLVEGDPQRPEPALELLHGARPDD